MNATDSPAANDRACLDTIQLDRLEQSFRSWLDSAKGSDVRLSRQRIFLIFLLIRYAGAKLNEVLKLNLSDDFDSQRHLIRFASVDKDGRDSSREVRIPEAVSDTLATLLATASSHSTLQRSLEIDPGFVRRKFYERTRAIGLPPHLGGPEMIRKARAVELLLDKMPLPAVQVLLGHSTPNLTSAYVSFSEEELQTVTRYHIERNFSRKTSACNAFFGKIQSIRRGDIQAIVEIATVSGSTVQSIITHASLEQLGLATGKLVRAEVKAPWVLLAKGMQEPACTAENRFSGTIERIRTGQINSEYSIRLDEGTELCAIGGSSSGNLLGLQAGDRVWAFFSCYAVILHVD